MLVVWYTARSGVETVQAAQLVTMGQRVILGAFPLTPVVQLLLIGAFDVAVVLQLLPVQSLHLPLHPRPAGSHTSGCLICSWTAALAVGARRVL